MTTLAAETVELTRGHVESIVAMTAEGRWPDRAAGELGILKATFETWIEKGMNDAVEDADSLERELVERVYIADCQAEGKWFIGLRGRIETNKFFAGYMAFMSRRWPERWIERKPDQAQPLTFEDEVRSFYRGVETAREEARKADQPA